MSPADRGGLGLPPMPKALAAAAEGALSARTLPPGASPGLVWDRYPRVWRGAAIGAAKERADFLSAFVRDMNSADVKAAGEGALSAVRARLVAAGAISRSFTLTAPLCTGLGLEHPTENGFAFDAVHGLPMLAGTGLKGLARAAAQALGEPEAVVTALLGSDVPDGHGSGDATSPGTVRFWGAWPAVWPKLRVELINPHHPSYQQDQAGSYAGEPEASRGKRPRRRQVADYTEEPVPVSFLALDHSQDLVVFLDALPGRSPDLERVWWWLAVGFEHLGAGGKTASGYGRAKPRGWEPTPAAAPASAPTPQVTGPVLLSLTGPIPKAPSQANPAEPPGFFIPQLNDAELLANVQAELGARAPVGLRPLKLNLRAKGEGWGPTIESLRAFVDGTEPPVGAVFGFASIPALVAFGALLGDKGSGPTFDAPRGLQQGQWEGDAAPLKLERHLDRKQDAPGVVVLLELSGPIDSKQVPKSLAGLPTAGIRLDGAAPGRFRSREHVNQLREAWRALLADVRERFGAVPIHLLAAAPLSAAVECGRRLVQADPPIHVYEAGTDADRTFTYQLTVTAGDAYEDSRLKHTGPVDLLIMVALIEEAEQLLKVLGDVTPVEDDHGYSDLYVVRQGRTIVVRTCDTMGPGGAQAATSSALTKWQPKVAAWLGIAGALSEDLKLCDVLVPDQVSHYDATSKLVDHQGVTQHQLRPVVFRPDQALARKVSGIRLNHPKPYEQWQRQGEADLNAEIAQAGGGSAALRAKHARARPNLYKPHLASGGSVISAASAKTQLLATDASLKAVDMESAGLAWAAEATSSPPPLVIVRGISDDGSEHKKALDAVGEGAFRRVAMRNASRLLLLALDLGLLRPTK